MKSIHLKTLKITNFKGIKEKTVSFDLKETTISGANATGKSTLQDAFTWLLFGKDSADRKDFNIKNTVDTDLNRQDHVVEAVLIVAKVEHIIKRVYKEKWVKKRGEETPEFTGHETEYFWNEVPVNQAEFQSKVQFILPEDQFKLLTNPLYFNQIKWQTRREMLEQLAGEVSLEAAAGTDKDLKALLDRLNKENKTMEEALKQYASERKNIKKALDAIPGRIDEAGRTNGTAEKYTPEAVKAAQDELSALTDTIRQYSANTLELRKAIQQRKEKIAGLERLLMDIEGLIKRERNTKISELDDKISNFSRKFAQTLKEKEVVISKINELHEQADKYKSEMDKLRGEWKQENAKQFHLNGEELLCPTCKQKLPDATDRAEELKANFEKAKTEKLHTISQNGVAMKTWLEKVYQEELEANTEAIEGLKQEMLSVNKQKTILMEERDALSGQPIAFQSDENWYKANKELETLLEDLVMPVDDNAIKEIEKKRDELADYLSGYKQYQEQLAKQKQRVQELMQEEKTLAQQLADKERVEFMISKLQRNHSSAIEQAVNSKFEGVTFRLFEQQINGGEKPTCETLVAGVPYQDANHAAQINAGISIINTFNKVLDITAPIWVDNAEAVNKLQATESQLIRLVVTEDKTLTIEPPSA